MAPAEPKKLSEREKRKKHKERVEENAIMRGMEWFKRVTGEIVATMLLITTAIFYLIAMPVTGWAGTLGVLGGLWLLAKPKLKNNRPYCELPKPGRDVEAFVVLGSGGHTSELLEALKGIEDWAERYKPIYIIADTDHQSKARADKFQKMHGKTAGGADVECIPRAREVGQSYITSIWSTLLAFYRCFSLAWAESPHVVFTSGPGTCVPMIAAAFILRPLSLFTFGSFRRTQIVYLESFTCVDHLSVSGKICYPFTDIFGVQWEEVASDWPIKATKKDFEQKVSNLCRLTQPLGALPPKSEPEATKYCLVTVGTTKFDELIEQVNKAAFLAPLSRMGITKFYVQYGTGEVLPNRMATFAGHPITLTAYERSDDLPRVIKKASLVISHAGAGTILEVLGARVPLVVVPNTKLMSDHQTQLANRLAQGNYLYTASVDQLNEKLKEVQLDGLEPLPGPVALKLAN